MSRGMPQFVIRNASQIQVDLNESAIKAGYMGVPIYLQIEKNWDNDLGYNECAFSTTVEKKRREEHWKETFAQILPTGNESYINDNVHALYATEFGLTNETV
jgi:hypothetical protein